MRHVPLRSILCCFVLIGMLSPARADVTIDPPAGWKPIDVKTMPIRYEAMWAAEPTDGFAQNISLLKQTAPGMTLDAYVDLNEKQLQSMDANLIFSVNVREKCGASAMQRVKYSSVFGSRNIAIEQLLVADGGAFYIVTYGRLVDQPELPEASAALQTICNHLSGTVS